MNKFWLGFQGYWSCFSWMLSALFTWILETCPDLKFWEGHTDIDDHLWYAERVNGRIAMLVLSAVLLYEFTTHTSIWSLIDGIKSHALLP
jgi:hypothetical protein